MGTPKSQHVPPPIAREDFQAGHLKPGSYSLEDISSAIIDHVQRPELTSIQDAAIRRYYYSGSWSISCPDNIDDIKKFFEIFDDVFFNGLLRGLCTLELFTDTHRRQGCIVGGYCTHEIPGGERDPRYRLERPKCHIALCTAPKDDTWAEKIEWYLGLLMHEMLHAVFSIYVCTCENGCYGKFQRAYLSSSYAAHDETWQAAAYAIELQSKSRNGDMFCGDDDGDGDNEGRRPRRGHMLLGLNLDLQRNNSLAAQVHAGGNLPNAAELRRLGLDIVEIWNSIRIRRMIENSIPCRQRKALGQFLKTNKCLRANWTVDSWEQARLEQHRRRNEPLFPMS